MAKHVVSGEVTDTFHIDLADKENTLDEAYQCQSQRGHLRNLRHGWIQRSPCGHEETFPRTRKLSSCNSKKSTSRRTKAPWLETAETMQKLVLLPESNLAIDMDCKGESGHARRTSMIPNCYPIHWTLCATEHAHRRILV